MTLQNDIKKAVDKLSELDQKLQDHINSIIIEARLNQRILENR
jgi:hypothetical protein